MWAKEPCENRKKITKVQYCRVCEGKVYRGVNHDVGRFRRQACLLMYALNVNRRCCIVPQLSGADRGTIENYPRPHPQGIEKYILIRFRPLIYQPLRRGMLPPRRVPSTATTDRRTDRRDCRSYYCSLHCKQCGCAVIKIGVLNQKQKQRI